MHSLLCLLSVPSAAILRCPVHAWQQHACTLPQVGWHLKVRSGTSSRIGAGDSSKTPRRQNILQYNTTIYYIMAVSCPTEELMTGHEAQSGLVVAFGSDRPAMADGEKERGRYLGYILVLRLQHSPWAVKGGGRRRNGATCAVSAIACSGTT